MSITVTGTQFWRFYNDDKYWPEGAWHEDTLVKVNEKTVEDYTETTIPGNAQVTVQGGVIMLDKDGFETVSFEKHLERWLKEQTSSTFLVECPIDIMETVRAAIIAAGGKIVTA